MDTSKDYYVILGVLPEAEPEVDDEDLTADDLQSDWEFIVDYHPELNGLLKEVSSIFPTLSIVFQSTIVSKKAFNEANKIKDQLILSFLHRYFGDSKPIQKFGKPYCLKHNCPLREN